MLPAMDGFEVCRRMRAHGPVPVIMLTARGDEEDRILGLETGADDYVTKPFSPRELVLRVESVLRRAGAGTPAAEEARPLSGAGLCLDPVARSASRGGAGLALTLREFDLLAFLLRHPGRAFGREELMREVWGWDFGDLSTVTVHIRRLRGKVEQDPARPRLIRTVWGVGYRLDLPGDGEAGEAGEAGETAGATGATGAPESPEATRAIEASEAPRLLGPPTIRREHPVRDLLLIALFAFLGAAAAGLLGALVLRLLRHRSLVVSMSVVAGVAVAAMLAGTLTVAWAMFLSSHDLYVVTTVVAMAAVVSLVTAVLLGRWVAAPQKPWPRSAPATSAARRAAPPPSWPRSPGAGATGAKLEHAARTSAELGSRRRTAKLGTAHARRSRHGPGGAGPACTTKITGTRNGPLTVTGGVTCVDRAALRGPVTVRAGAALVLTGSTLEGPLQADRAAAIHVCGSGITGPLAISRTTGPVRLGGPGCTANSVTGAVVLTGNTGGVLLAANRITGPVACSGNLPAPDTTGRNNEVRGPRTGQCAGV
ncbi:hypothetical protein SMICM17S_03458 [Streptomyces microflavus]